MRVFLNQARRDVLEIERDDRANAVLAAAGYNFGLLLRWLAELLRALMTALLQMPRFA